MYRFGQCSKPICDERASPGVFGAGAGERKSRVQVRFYPTQPAARHQKSKGRPLTFENRAGPRPSRPSRRTFCICCTAVCTLCQYRAGNNVSVHDPDRGESVLNFGRLRGWGSNSTALAPE